MFLFITYLWIQIDIILWFCSLWQLTHANLHEKHRTVVYDILQSVQP